MDYYDVTGTTPQEVRASLDQRSPDLHPRRRAPRCDHLRDHPWRFTFRGLPNCAITGANVTATIRSDFRRLMTDDRTPASLKQAFARYTDRLMVYQKGHIDKIVEAARQIDIGIRGLPDNQWCRIWNSPPIISATIY